MAQTPTQKRVAATSAMQALAKISPDLANRIADDFVSAGFTYSAAVRGDVNEAYLLNPQIGATLRTFFSDPVAVQQEGNNVLTQISQPVASAVGNAATATARTGQDVAAATGKGLASTFSGPLGPLFQGAIWLRVAEVALGVILLAVGIAKLTNAVPIATRIAKVM